jgi:hypothetical protein
VPAPGVRPLRVIGLCIVVPLSFCDTDHGSVHVPERKKPKKPTGVAGPTLIDLGKRVNSFNPLVFPPTKPEIEKLVLHAALASNRRLREHYGIVGEPKQVREQDYDFTLPTATGETYLDLMEFAPLRKTGRSYDRVPRSYMAGDRADAIWDEVTQKSEWYGRPPLSGIHLMLYSTDFRLYAYGPVADLLVHLSHRLEHCFRSIVYTTPFTEASAQVAYLFPLPEADRAKLEPEDELRRWMGITFHPSEIVHLPPGARRKRTAVDSLTRNKSESGQDKAS